MRVVAAVLAAGQGTRFGVDKTQIKLKGKPVWRYSYDTLINHPRIDGVGVVTSIDNIDAVSEDAVGAAFVIKGGATRQQSARNAIDIVGDSEIILLHDAARPFVSSRVIEEVLDAVERAGAAAPGIPITDTIRRKTDSGYETIDRTDLFAMQTPQGARVELLRRAYAQTNREFTDEMSLLQSFGVACEIVHGEENNFKITRPEDIARSFALLGPSETRTGIGYDIHPFSQDPNRKLFLGGVLFEGAPGLEGHSDADVLLHAITDALLGAAGLGDIGQHFPNTDPQWKGKSSIYFLNSANSLLKADGWRILNIDATLIAEFPKVMKEAEAIRERISEALGIEPRRVSIKATTNERLGSIGRGEGIAAFAVATLVDSA